MRCIYPWLRNWKISDPLHPRATLDEINRSAECEMQINECGISRPQADYDSGEVWNSRSVKSAPSAAKCNSRLPLWLSAGAPLSCFFRSRGRSGAKSFTVCAFSGELIPLKCCWIRPIHCGHLSLECVLFRESLRRLCPVVLSRAVDFQKEKLLQLAEWRESCSHNKVSCFATPSVRWRGYMVLCKHNFLKLNFYMHQIVNSVPVKFSEKI